MGVESSGSTQTPKSEPEPEHESEPESEPEPELVLTDDFVLSEDKKRLIRGLIEAMTAHMGSSLISPLFFAELADEEKAKRSQLPADYSPTIRFYELLMDLFCEFQILPSREKEYCTTITKECPSQPKQSYLVFKIFEHYTVQTVTRCSVCVLFS